MFAVLLRWQTAVVEADRKLALKVRELSELNQTLDQRVAERTSELQEANQRLMSREGVMRSLLEDLQKAKEQIEQQAGTLQTANVRLKDLSVTKDEFVAKVSHELRTPLTSIKEGLSLLLDNALGETTEEQRDFLQTMDSDIDRLTELINNMLDLSKIEAGRVRLHRQRTDIRETIHTLMRSFQSLIGRRTIRADFADVPATFVDHNRIIQVLSNLFSNALKFTAEDGTILFHVAHEADRVTVSVQDNGPGMTPEDLSKLFQKFSQVGPRETGKPRGTGLGLVVCKELTELHRGQIDVTSTVGQGTTFRVSLPVYTDVFALSESFRELREAISSDDEVAVGLVAIDASAYVEEHAAPSNVAQALERLQAEVQRHLHRGDIVLAIEPSWIVILAQTDYAGCEAVIRRLRGSLTPAGRFRFGAAVYPLDAETATALYDHATKTLDQGAAALVDQTQRTAS